MRRTVTSILLLAVLLASGCATDKRNDTLVTTLNAYGSTLRWAGFAAALDYVDPDYREAHPLSDLDKARYQQVRVSGYDEGEGPVPAGENEVRQVVRISLINLNTQRERSIVDQQVWKYDPKKKRWWLETGLPDITRD